MKGKGIIVLVYALLVLVGGIIGYMKAQSVASLMMGVLSSLFLSISAFSVIRGNRLGLFFSFALTAFLGAFFIYRFILTHHFMPAGLMCVLSAIVLTALLMKNKDISTPS